MFWSNLFKKKNKIFNTEIVNNTSSKIPSFEELTTKEQEYVSNQKEEYLKFYENEDNYINLDNELFNEIKMYQDLALDIMHKDHFGNIANSIIDSKKLAYYSQKITEINNTLKYKYIALNELRKDKKYLTKHMGLYVLGRRKINILKALDHQMNIINNMFVIADQKITDYCACAIANYPKNIDETTEKELNNRYIEVEKDYKDLFNSSIELDDSISIADEITYMEILIDKFIYENKDLINKLKEQLDIIAFNEIIDAKEQQEKISNLKKTKMYYLIFNKYGRNLIAKDDFNDLYQIIFNVYTYFPISSGFTEYFNKKANKDELILYSKIIKGKSEAFILKQSKIFEANKVSDKAYSLLLKIFNLTENDEIYKNMFIYDDFNIKFFPNVELLLSLDFVDGIDKYFDKKAFDHPLKLIGKEPWISKNALKKDYYKYVFGLCINPGSKQDITSQNQYSIDLIKLRQYYESEEIVLYYLLYKDKINFNVLPYLSKDCDLSKFSTYLRNSCIQSKDKSINIYIPSNTKMLSLRPIDIVTDTVSGTYIHIYSMKIHVNEQLEKIIIGNDVSLNERKIQVMLPEISNLTNIFYEIYKPYYLKYDELLRRIRGFSESIILPNKIFNMEDNCENNKWLFDYLFNLFYENIMNIGDIIDNVSRITNKLNSQNIYLDNQDVYLDGQDDQQICPYDFYDSDFLFYHYYFNNFNLEISSNNYKDIFYELFNNLTILEKDNHLYSVGCNVKHSYKESCDISTKIRKIKDIIEAYKIYIEYYIKDLNTYKKELKSQLMHEEKQISAEPKKLTKKN